MQDAGGCKKWINFSCRSMQPPIYSTQARSRRQEANDKTNCQRWTRANMENDSPHSETVWRQHAHIHHPQKRATWKKGTTPCWHQDAMLARPKCANNELLNFIWFPCRSSSTKHENAVNQVEHWTPAQWPVQVLCVPPTRTKLWLSSAKSKTIRINGGCFDGVATNKSDCRTYATQGRHLSITHAQSCSFQSCLITGLWQFVCRCIVGHSVRMNLER